MVQTWWVLRYRENLPDGSTTRRSVAIGTVKEFPNESQARKAALSWLFSMNAEASNGAPVSFGAVIRRYLAEEIPERPVGNPPPEWWRALAQVPRGKDDGLVGYPWSLRLHGLSLRACRFIAIPCVETGQQKRNAYSKRIRGTVRCLRLGSSLDKLRLAPHSQPFTHCRHDRRPAGQPTSRLQTMRPQCSNPTRKFSTL